MNNPVVLVTGRTLYDIRASRRHCPPFAKKGAKVVVAGRRDDAGKALVKELRSLGSEAGFIPNADVRKEEGVRALVDKTIARFGRLDVAVNNAGTEGRGGQVTEQSAEGYRRDVRHTNDFSRRSPEHEARSARRLQVQGNGNIINISSRPMDTRARPGLDLRRR